MININDIEKIMQIADKFDFSHFELHQDDRKIVIEKNRLSETAINEPSKVEAKVFESKEETALNEENVEKEYIKASFAGTFYSRKEKDGPTFVNLYDDVKNDTVVGLLEVMKLFNDVEAGAQGTIVAILVKDGDFVEYGQLLFEIKTK